MKPCRRLARVRHQVRQLAALVEARAALADGHRGDDRFRLLTEAEAEVIVGADLIAALATGAGVLRF